MTQTTVIRLESQHGKPTDLRQYISKFPKKVAQWRRDDVIFVGRVFQGVVWDPFNADKCCEELESGYGFTCEIPLAATNRHRDAIAYFAPAVEFARANDVMLTIDVAPSDSGLEAVVGKPVFLKAAHYTVQCNKREGLADNVIICLDQWNYIDSYELDHGSDDSSDVANWSVELNPLIQQRLSTVCVAIVCAFDRELKYEEFDRLTLYRLVCHYDRGWYLDDGSIVTTDDSIGGRNHKSSRDAPFLYVVECPVNQINTLRDTYDSMKRKGIDLFQQYSLLDRLPPDLSFGVEGWMESATVRQPFLTQRIVTLSLVLHPLVRYVLIEILEWLSEISRLVPRRRLDALTAAVYESIKRIGLLRDQPSRNTRSRKPPRINTTEQVSL